MVRRHESPSWQTSTGKPDPTRTGLPDPGAAAGVAVTRPVRTKPRGYIENYNPASDTRHLLADVTSVPDAASMNDRAELRALFPEVVRQLPRSGNSLSVDSRMLLLAILQHIIDDGDLPATSVLGVELGMGERRLRQGQRELVSSGLLRVRRRGSMPNDYIIDVHALAAWAGTSALVCDQAPAGEASRSVKTQEQIRQPAGTTTSALSIPPPPATPTVAAETPGPPAPSARPAASESQRGGRIGGRGVSPHGSGGRYGHGKNNPAAVLPELADLRRMESFFDDAGIRLSEALRKILHRWIRDGVPIEDVAYGCSEAARHDARRFAYVETIIQRLKKERSVLRTMAPADVAQSGPILLDSYRAGRGG